MKKCYLLTLTFAILLLNVKMAMAQVPSYLPTNGLVGWWPFNGNANDESSNGNNGTVNGATLTTDRFGNAGKAYSFDGVNDYIQCINAGPTGNSTTSVAFWSKSISNSNTAHLVSWGGNGNSGQDFRVLANPYNACSTSIAFDTYNSGIGLLNSYSQNSWDFYVVTYDSTIGNTIASAKIYKNGILLSSTCFSQNFSTTNISSEFPITFGRYHGNLLTDYLSGSLDDIAIYNRALSAQEVSALYTASATSTSCTASINQNDTTICGGESLSLTASSSTTNGVTDIDGNFYPSVNIGNQTWTQKNLNVSKYRNGDPIPQVTSPTQWANLTTGAWCWYGNDSLNYSQFGKLYNWYAVNDPRGLAPQGWHVPTLAEWLYMIDTTLGGFAVAGGKMKSISGWNQPNVGATNSSGFSAISTGYRDNMGNFQGVGIDAYWWGDPIDTSKFGIFNGSASISLNQYQKQWGFSTRGILNNSISYLWSTGATTPTISVSPTVSTTYYCTITDGSGNSCTDSVRITVNNCNTACLPSYLPTNGLVGYWPFCGNANDVSGNGNNGTVNGATLTTDRFGNAGKAYSFDGVSSNILVPHSNSLNSMPISVSCWFNAKTQISPAGALVGKYFASSYNGWQLTLNETGVGNRIDPWYIRSNGNYVKNSIQTPGFYTGSIIDSTWHHAVFVVDTNGGKIFVDGNLVASTNWVGPYGITTNNYPVYFGYYPSSNTFPNVYYFKGILDDIAIFNRALSAQEITALYTGSSSSTSCLPSYLPTNGLVGYWPFCGNANDESGNGNNGTVNGATLTTDRFGQAGKAYDFDGNSNIITSSINTNTQQITLSSWFKLDSYSQTGRRIISQNWQSGGAFSVGILGTDFSGGTIFQVCFFTGNPCQSTNIIVPINDWYHFASTYENGLVRVYINGQLVLTDSGLLPLQGGNFPIEFGGTSIFKFDGIIDDIAIYNRALSAQEIATLYTNSAPVCTGSPATPSAINGPVNVCDQIGNNSVSTPVGYRCNPVNGAVSYAWILPAGVNLLNGQGTDSITVTFNASYSSGIISVRAYNACDSVSRSRNLSVNKRVPASVGSIYKSFNPLLPAVTSVCTVSAETYRIRKVQFANAYLWSLSNGSNATLTRLVGPGVNDTAVSVSFGSAFTSDSLRVQAINNCGVSNVRSLLLSKNLPPPSASSITNTGGNFSPCRGDTILYRANSLAPTASQSAPASYRWRISNGVVILSASADSSTVLLHFTSAFNGGFMSVRTVSACGVLGGQRTIYFRWFPPTPVSITSSTGSFNACSGNTVTYSALVGSLTAAQRTPAYYRWTLPAGATISSANTDSSVINVLFGTSYRGGGLSVRGVTACGVLGGSRAVTLTNSNCVSCIANISTADTTICAGSSVTLTATSTSSGGNTGGNGLTGTLTNGLVGYWPFNGNANDESGNGNNGTVNGATLTTDRFGNAGKAYSFNGSNSWIVIPNTSALSFSSGVTYSSWVYANDYQLASIIDKQGFVGGGFRTCIRSAASGSLFSSKVWATSGQYTQGTTAISNSAYPINQWIFIVGVYNQSQSSIKIYIDGVLSDSIFSSNINVDGSLANIFFGKRTDGNFEILNGKLDDIGIWNRALTPQEVQQLYTGSTTNGVTDIDGNNYPSVNIGTQTWTQKNLNVSRYRNGDVIPQVTNATQWANLTTGAWCWYNNDSATYAATYGKLYNWYAVTDPRGLAPQGWHVPSDGEWNRLVKFVDPASDTSVILGDQSSIAGGYLKETGTSHWLAPNTGASNSFGFTALPSGYREPTAGNFAEIGTRCVFWSSTISGNSSPFVRYLYEYQSVIAKSNLINQKDGFSVRCLRDANTNSPSQTPIYQWSNGATTPTITVNPTQTTTYYCTITSSNGAVCTDSVTVTVNNNCVTSCTANILNNDTTICAGQPVTLTATSTAVGGSGLTGTLTNGLVGYWPFNGNANDESGNGNNGTVNGATLTTDRFGVSNKAISFNGSLTTRINVSLTQPIASRADKTFSVWIKQPATYVNPYSHIITCDNVVPQSGESYLSTLGNEPSYVSAGTVGRFYEGKAGFMSSTTLNDNIWHHLVLINDFSGFKSDLYIDGQFNGSLSSNNYLMDTLINNIAFGNVINPTNTAANAALMGTLDDIAIWNRALSATEIQQLYARQSIPSNVPTNGLVGYWPFNGNANDESGNANNGTVNGATLTTDRFGNAGKAYGFDGNGDFIDVNDNSSLDLLSQYTLSSWFNVTSYPSVNDLISVILSKERYLGASGYGLCITASGNPFDMFNNIPNGSSSGVNASLTSSVVIPLNQWKQFTVVHNGQRRYLYVDGVIVTEQQFSNQLLNSNQNLFFGKEFTGNTGGGGYSNRYFNGKIDDIGIWNRALSASEVQQLYSVSSQTPTYQWSNGATTPTITVNPTQTTTFYCTITYGNVSCTDSVVVTVQPTTLGTPSGIAGPVDVCVAIGNNANSAPQTYVAAAVTGASGYTWTVPAGATIASGQGTPTITVIFSSNYTSGNITVRATNACNAISGARSLTVIKSSVASPGGIYKSFTPLQNAVSNVCGINAETYRIRRVANATGYVWSFANGTGTTITSLAGAGVNDTAVQVSFGSSFVADSLRVRAVSACSISDPRSIFITRLTASAAINEIANPGGNFSPCIGDTLTYTATALAPTSAQTAVSGYRWTLAPGAVILSATADSSVITVYFSPNFNGGVISVRTRSACGGLGSPKTVYFRYYPPTPSTIISSTGSFNGCVGGTATYNVQISALSSSQRAAAFYRWTLPAGVLVTGANSDSSSITVQFVTGYTGGFMRVRGVTACGVIGNFITQGLTNIGCAQGSGGVSVTKGMPSQADRLEVRLSPNPTRGAFQLWTGSDQLLPVWVRVYDAQGRRVGVYQTVVGRTLTFGKSWVSGLYMISVEQGSERVVVRGVKE
jgi:uncharacterized protein (TIGR02145 family)